MASEAEVDLVISTADTLPDLERDLQQIIRRAEDGAETLDVEAALAVGASLANVAEQIERVVSSAESGASDIELEAALDTQRSLTHIQGQIESLVQRASQGEEIELQAELDAIGSLRGVENQLRTLVATAEAAAPEIELEVTVDEDGEGERQALNLGRAFSSLAGPLARTAAGIGALGLAAGSAAPLLAGVAVAVQSIAPASAVAVSGMLAIQLAAGTVKVAMAGVSEAIETAFDPKAKPEDLAKALERLAPTARAFVKELRSMKSEFDALREEVQQNFFVGFDKALSDLSDSVLPQVRQAMANTSVELNTMALGAAQAAIQLGKDGTLGRALDSAVAGIRNLQSVPNLAVTALGQLAAAAGPSFERITAAAAASADKISEKLAKAFESGALEESISSAVDAVAQLGRIFGNVFAGIGNIIDTVSGQGEGLFGVMEKLTQAFEDVTASKGFQQALTALSQTAGVLATTVFPLISQALQSLGPVFQALAAPVQILVRALGEGLGKIIAALEPVLVSLANAFGQLVLVVTPFINLAASLIAALLPALIPLFDGLGQALNAMIPFAEALVASLTGQLVPVFTTLATEVLPQLIPPFVELSTKLFPVLTDIITKLAPILAQLAVTFAQLLVAVTPVIVELLNLAIALADELLPIIQPIIDVVVKFIEIALKVLAAQITGLIIPTIRILVDLLQGDFSGAWEGAKNLVTNVTRKIEEVVGRMGGEVVRILGDLGNQARQKFNELVQSAVEKFTELGNRARDIMGRLPGIILSALGNLGNLLVSAGSDLVQGLINGISGKLGELRAKAGEIASAVSGSVKDLLGIQSPSTVMMEVGRDTLKGFEIGLGQGVPDLRSQLQGIASLAPSFALPDGRSIQLPQLGTSAPTVQVYLGNELINAHVDARIATSSQARDLLMTQGVRR